MMLLCDAIGSKARYRLNSKWFSAVSVQLSPVKSVCAQFSCTYKVTINFVSHRAYPMRDRQSLFVCVTAPSIGDTLVYRRHITRRYDTQGNEFFGKKQEEEDDD